MINSSTMFVLAATLIGSAVVEAQPQRLSPTAEASATPASQRQEALSRLIGQSTQRLNSGNRGLLAQDLQGLQSGFQGLTPFFGTFQPHDYERNRALVRQAFGFLAQAELVAQSDPGLLGSVANSYGFLGDYSLQPGLRSFGFGPGAGFAFGRAGRLGRGLILNGGGRRFERDFERFALGWATQSLLFNGAWPYRVRQQSVDDVYVQPPVEPRDPIQVAKVDAAALTAQQKEAWDELRGEAVAVTARVNETVNNLDQLAARLKARGMQPNSNDVATAFRMQSFLEEANERLTAKDFEKAKLALQKAEYERKRLKGVATQ